VRGARSNPRSYRDSGYCRAAFYKLDRNSGQFLRADPYQEKITWTKGIDPKTGKPIDYNPATPVSSMPASA
jgi:alcohol dehydrogenase (cytochrome c)